MPSPVPRDALWRQGQCSRGQGQWFRVKATPSKSAGQAPPGCWRTSPASCFSEFMQWQNLLVFPFAEHHGVQFPPVGWGEPAGTNPPAPQSHQHLGTHPRHRMLSVSCCSRVCAMLLSSSPATQQAPSPCLSPNYAGNPKTSWDLITQRLRQLPSSWCPAGRILSNKTLASMLKSKAGGLGWAAKIPEGICGQVKAATPCEAAGFGSPPEQGGSGATRGPSCGFGAGGGCVTVRRAFVHRGGRKRVFWSCS